MTSGIPANKVRQAFLEHIKAEVHHWSVVDSEHHDTCKKKLDGLAHSILCMFDGVTSEFPAMDIVLRPHPENKQDAIDNEDDWFESGQVINSNKSLHEEFSDTKSMWDYEKSCAKRK